MKTFLPRDPGVDRQWYIMDAEGQSLGRLAVKIVKLLRGKQKVCYTPQVDLGDFVVVINAGKVRLTGRKPEQKIYRQFSGYRGGLKETKASVMREQHPDRMIKHAVVRMLPKNYMSRKLIRRLKVYAGKDHPHAAQKPTSVK